MTAAHLARTMMQTKARERAKIAQELDNRADVLDGDGKTDLAQELREQAEAVRSPAAPASLRLLPSAPMRDGPDPLDTVDERVAAEEQGDGLPPVRFLPDEVEGAAMVRNLSARGKLNL